MFLGTVLLWLMIRVHQNKKLWSLVFVWNYVSKSTVRSQPMSTLNKIYYLLVQRLWWLNVNCWVLGVLVMLIGQLTTIPLLIIDMHNSYTRICNKLFCCIENHSTVSEWLCKSRIMHRMLWILSSSEYLLNFVWYLLLSKQLELNSILSSPRMELEKEWILLQGVPKKSVNYCHYYK